MKKEQEIDLRELLEPGRYEAMHEKALKTFHKYYDLLLEVGCPGHKIVELAAKWCEPHRYYHTIDHLIEILDLIENAEKTIPAVKDYPQVVKLLKIIAIFHDAVYNLIHKEGEKSNEELSADLMKELCPNLSPEDLTIVYNAILDTKDHTKEPSSDISKIFLDYDLHGLLYGTLDRKIADQKKLTKEFGCYDYSLYKEGHGKIIKHLATHVIKVNPKSNIYEYINWFENREIRIAVFPGSFFPLHAGHIDILKQAEKQFDKVILAFGVNPSKNADIMEREHHMNAIKKLMPNYQIEMFSGFLTEYIKSKLYPVTVVKGLRNVMDFDSEKVQLRYMEDMYPEIAITYIISDRKYEHVSSSGIRQLRMVDKENTDLINKYTIPGTLL